MRKIFKCITVAAAAAVITLSSVFFGGCAYQFTPLEGDVSGEVSSQGGFVVEKGEYVYFINGVETYTSDNTYGTPVKGALMRIKTADIKAGNNTAETVIPSLMVAADYTSGIYIYGDRVYYATPNNVGNTGGDVDNTLLSFRSARLDGSDVQEHFRVADNATVYRYVEADGVVYILYEEDGTLSSYNTAEDVNTTLAEGVTEYVLNSTEKGDPYVYYTMTVTDGEDTEAPYEYTNYNQIYRVRADATEAPYEYTWDQEYLDENNDGEVPYVNLGELVLDGIGRSDGITQFNHDVDEENNNRLSYGFTYTLQAYTNGGIYFVRASQPTSGSSVGSSGELYYLAVDDVAAEGWNSVSGNSVYTSADTTGVLEVVASASDTTNASSAAYFYIDEDSETGVKHHYLYVNDAYIYRVDVVNDGNGTKAQIGEGGASSLRIASDASNATLIAMDSVSDSTYSYIYYTKSGSSGLTVERAVYNGEAEDYRTLSAIGENNAPYKAVQLFELEHASSWYNYEIVDGILFYANAQAFGDTSYNYVWTVDLTNADGSLMNNEALEALNEKYDAIMGETDGYIAALSEEGNGKLSDMIEYFFYTGERTAVDENIEESIENGKSETYLYSEEEKDAFTAFVNGEGDAADFEDENGTLYTTLSYFTTRIGAMSEGDEETYHEYWRDVLQRYTVAEEETGLPAWAWALIGVGIGVVVVGAGLAVFFLVRKRKKQAQQPREARMAVDTTDDKTVDVYHTDDAVTAEATVQQLTPEEAAQAESVSEGAEAGPAESSAAEASETKGPSGETPDDAPSAPEE